MTNDATPGNVRLNDGLGPNVEMPEPIGAVMPENGTEYVDCYSADQMHDYAGACVLAATTECSKHWQAKASGLEQVAAMLALERADLRAVLSECQLHLSCNAVTADLVALYGRVRAALGA